MEGRGVSAAMKLEDGPVRRALGVHQFFHVETAHIKSCVGPVIRYFKGMADRLCILGRVEAGIHFLIDIGLLGSIVHLKARFRQRPGRRGRSGEASCEKGKAHNAGSGKT